MQLPGVRVQGIGFTLRDDMCFQARGRL